MGQKSCGQEGPDCLAVPLQLKHASQFINTSAFNFMLDSWQAVDTWCAWMYVRSLHHLHHLLCGPAMQALWKGRMCS